MEDGLLRDKRMDGTAAEKPILILVVMEDSLWLKFNGEEMKAAFNLNPCCNGR